jgi:putative transcriptional regulator
MNRTHQKRLAAALDTINRYSELKPYAPKPVDVAKIRKRIGLTQEQFARRFGFPVATLRHWERGDRTPRGPALVLLNLIAGNSQAVLQALGRCR